MRGKQIIMLLSAVAVSLSIGIMIGQRIAAPTIAGNVYGESAGVEFSNPAGGVYGVDGHVYAACADMKVCECIGWPKLNGRQ